MNNWIERPTSVEFRFTHCRWLLEKATLCCCSRRNLPAVALLLFASCELFVYSMFKIIIITSSSSSSPSSHVHIVSCVVQNNSSLDIAHVQSSACYDLYSGSRVILSLPATFNPPCNTVVVVVGHPHNISASLSPLTLFSLQLGLEAQPKLLLTMLTNDDERDGKTGEGRERERFYLIKI